MVVIMGAVGCGKTSLLHAIMGENSKKDGTTSVVGSIAYVEQEPFIFSATIKDNVCFGRKFDEKRFNGAMKAS
jgi:ABC-type transport system involved in cytochrome bd biosynthesis fused ATPase/permease subunit